jgi:hypothetical protein
VVWARLATSSDLESIVAMTTESRYRLADWSPVWWRVAPRADADHPAWLGRLIDMDGPVVRVVVANGGDVVGCAFSMPQRSQWFVDDVALVRDGLWETEGAVLMGSVRERPALTCVPASHSARARASESFGLELVSSYWIRATTDSNAKVESLRGDLDIPPAPPHTFGGGFDPLTEGALSFQRGDGFVIGSPSISAPPVYDPGGTVTVVDRIVGSDLVDQVSAALGAAFRRGDVLLNAVAAADDHPLQEVLAERGFDRTVEVYRWPSGQRR